MKRPSPVILAIPEPCAEDWARMTPDGCGRYCAACRKTVVDFTGWTDAAIARYFDGVDGDVCGRFLSTQLDRPLLAPAPPLKFSLAQWVAAAGIAAISIVAAGSPARAQAPLVSYVAAGEDTLRTTPGGTIGFSGVVRDEKGEPVIGATVIAYENGVIKGGAETGIDGDFKIAPLTPGVYDVQVNFIGYDTLRCTSLELTNNSTVVRDLLLRESHLPFSSNIPQSTLPTIVIRTGRYVYGGLIRRDTASQKNDSTTIPIKRSH